MEHLFVDLLGVLLQVENSPLLSFQVPDSEVPDSEVPGMEFLASPAHLLLLWLCLHRERVFLALPPGLDLLVVVLALGVEWDVGFAMACRNCVFLLYYEKPECLCFWG